MKIAVIGGGGVRSIFLARSLTLRAKELDFTEVVFMDNDPVKLKIYGGMARQVAKRIDPSLQFTLTTDGEKALTNADYIITTIRPGGDELRCRDERLALAKGVLGQETTGAAGLAFAMRTIPALTEYCELAKRVAKPGFLMFNFTNPAGLVSQALRDLGYDFTYGICDAPSGMLARMADFLGVPEESVCGDCYGLNHLSFFSSIRLEGREIMPELLRDPRIYTQTDMRYFKPDLVEHVGCILNEYLYYFYYRQEAVDNILSAGVTRGEVIADVNRHMLEELLTMDVEQDFDRCLAVYEKWHGKRVLSYMENETGAKDPRPPFRFDVTHETDSGYAGVALKYIESKKTGKHTEMILNLPNGGAIPTMAEDDVVEITCDLKGGVITPRPIQNPADMPMELIHRVKKYERLAAQAIIRKDRAMAIDSLMAHPLVNSYSIARDLVDAYIESNREFSQGWK